MKKHTGGVSTFTIGVDPYVVLSIIDTVILARSGAEVSIRLPSPTGVTIGWITELAEVNLSGIDG